MLGITQDIYEELMKKDMPFNIWAGGSKLSLEAGQWTSHEDCAKYYEGYQYTNTQQAIDKLEELKESGESGFVNMKNYSIDQAIAILKGEDNE